MNGGQLRSNAGRARPDRRTGDSVDLIMVVLTCTLAGLRDRLFEEGHDRAAEVVADLVEITDDYLDRIEA